MRQTRAYDMMKFPVCLCLDTSGSMSGRAITELNAAIDSFLNIIDDDAEARRSIETAIITFGSGGIDCAKDFTEHTAKRLHAGGMTPMGEAAGLALDMLEARIDALTEVGIKHHRPWLVLTLDGIPNGNAAMFTASAERIQSTVKRGRLEVFPVGITHSVDFKSLEAFSPLRRPLLLRDLDFAALFQWLGLNMIRAVSQRQGDSIRLTNPASWAEI